MTVVSKSFREPLLIGEGEKPRTPEKKLGEPALAAPFSPSSFSHFAPCSAFPDCAMAAALGAGKGDWVKLISQEGHEFIVDRDCAMVSGTINVSWRY